jgi:membrane protein insertase Oxa1/YidC/SpoIIIJ
MAIKKPTTDNDETISLCVFLFFLSAGLFLYFLPHSFFNVQNKEIKAQPKEEKHNARR